MKNLEIHELPKNLRGVKGLMNRDKTAEPVEKGILRALHNVHIFKDGTSRFDATDIPMTHFYPKEVMVSVEKLRTLGYTKDYVGNELVEDTQLVEIEAPGRGDKQELRRAHAQHSEVRRRSACQVLQDGAVLQRGQHTGHGRPVRHNACAAHQRRGAVQGNRLHRREGGLAHPYTISARRRNCDGDEDTTMLLLDALVNFSRSYLPITIGGTMDAPLILTINVNPEEVDDEVHDMEVVSEYGMDFYNKTLEYVQPGEVSMEIVQKQAEERERSSRA